MKKILIPLVLLAVSIAAISVYAYGEKKTQDTTAPAGSTVTSAKATAVSNSTTAKPTTQTTAKPAVTSTKTLTTKPSADEIAAAIKAKYKLGKRYALIKKKSVDSTEYYYEFVDKNGYRNRYDALRIIISDSGEVLHEKRFDRKAAEGKIVLTKSEALQKAGGGNITDILYFSADADHTPRLCYQVKNGYRITYVDAETGAITGEDTIK